MPSGFILILRQGINLLLSRVVSGVLLLVQDLLLLIKVSDHLLELLIIVLEQFIFVDVLMMLVLLVFHSTSDVICFRIWPMAFDDLLVVYVCHCLVKFILLINFLIGLYFSLSGECVVISLVQQTKIMLRSNFSKFTWVSDILRNRVYAIRDLFNCWVLIVLSLWTVFLIIRLALRSATLLLLLLYSELFMCVLSFLLTIIVVSILTIDYNVRIMSIDFWIA